MRLALRIVALSLVLLSAGGAAASVATIDAVPAATLLVPYFETDLSNPNGRNTVFRIGNVSAEASLAHVTLWSDLGIPTLNFDVYLAGYDVVTIDMRLVFEGIVPQTSSSLVNNGAFSLPPLAFPDCGGILPVGQVPPALVANIRAAHTGQEMPLDPGRCVGVDHGDNVARGYVTVDRVTRCSVLFPSDPGYFSGPTRVASDENTLWGEYWLIDRESNSSFGDNLVHIEASASDPRTTTSGNTTFYGRFVNWSADDHREALATTWQARTFVGSTALGTTELLIWRDPGLVAQSFACGSTSLPNPFPMSQQQTLAFDEAANQVVIPAETVVGPYATNAIRAGDGNLPTPFPFGFVILDLNSTVGSPVDPVRQSFVSLAHVLDGQRSIGMMAVPLDNAGDLAKTKRVEPALPVVDGAEVTP